MAVAATDLHRLEGRSHRTITTKVALLALAVIHVDGEYTIRLIKMAVH